MVPDIIFKLVERFERNREAYRSGGYNETQIRVEFIDHLFMALGWDVHNTQGHAEAYKDVIHEDAIKVGGVTKAPDYCFRIGPARKFFVEAKKPSINLKDDTTPAYQLRRYGWSAKLPLSILTDFEEFVVYDCRVKPAKTDKASKARIGYFSYTEYADRWNEIASIFSREAVLRGSFDKFAESNKSKRGTAEVDHAFLEEIEGWRDALAQNLALRNSNLTQRELNYSVQTIIDRIIFLRICEDRAIEPYGRLQGLLNGNNVYRRLGEFFQAADERYNSGLFHFQTERDRPADPDQLTLGLAIDDKVLKGILQRLYYPDSPYEFSVLPADILGQVYEQFLGKVIRLESDHRAVVEDKPEVKKAGGVYYTPTYIVDYIVKNTIGKRLEACASPKDVSKLRVLDPACGSGSFLIGAYQCLLDWHLEWYTNNGLVKWAKGRSPALYQGQTGDWRLTTGEKKRILLNNIYGVDIDSQAVEVTKLSLLLKVLEQQTGEAIDKSFKLFHERALPDLGANIKCGNSLIGPDFYETQTTLFDDEECYRINAFDWNREFAPIMKSGGFDAVIGNPPYGAVMNQTLAGYLAKRFEVTEGRFDTYELFIERGLTLCRVRGLLGFIVPSPLLSNVYTKKLRQYILAHCAIQEITNFGVDVFADPTIHTCIIVVSRGEVPGQTVLVRKQVSSTQDLQCAYDYCVPQGRLGNNERITFDIFVDPDSDALIQKLVDAGRPLGEMCFIRQCIKTGNDDVHVSSFHSPPDDPWRPTLRGRSIVRYATLDTNLYVRYGPWLARNWKNTSFYERPKIAVRETGNRIIASLDLDHRYFLSSLYAIYPKSPTEPVSLHCILGLLNSSPATYFLRAVALALTKGAFTKVRTNQMARLPMPRIDFSDRADKATHDRMVDLVQQMLDLNKRLAVAKTEHEKTNLMRQIDGTDDQIDQLVYDLYGLTDEEIAIVKGESQPRIPDP